MKKTFRAFGGRLHISVANELWFNTFASGDKFTYLIGLGKYDVTEDGISATVYTAHLIWLVVRIVSRIERVK